MARSETATNAVAGAASVGGTSLIIAGPVAGILGGVVLAGSLVLSAIVQGAEPLSAIQPMGARFASADALNGGSGRLVFGVFLHLGVSALVGLLFALVLPRDFPPRSAALLFVGFAFIVMGFMTSVVVPAVNPVLKGRFHDLGGSWVVAHALFGLTTGYVCQRLRRQGFSVRWARHVPQRTS